MSKVFRLFLFSVDNDWTQKGGTCYLALNLLTNADEAEDACSALGASLATIADEATYDFLIEYTQGLQLERTPYWPSYFPEIQVFWTSGRRDDDNSWVWLDNGTSEYWLASCELAEMKTYCIFFMQKCPCLTTDGCI